MANGRKMKITKSRVFRIVCNSLREMKELEDVPAYRVCKTVARRYSGGKPPGKAELKTALQRAVQDGCLSYNNRRYNLETDRLRCGCPSRSKPGILKRIKKYIGKVLKRKCKKKTPCKKKSLRSKRRQRKKKCRSKSRQKKAKRPTSRCGC